MLPPDKKERRPHLQRPPPSKLEPLAHATSLAANAEYDTQRDRSEYESGDECIGPKTSNPPAQVGILPGNKVRARWRYLIQYIHG